MIMSVSALDSKIFRGTFGTEEIRRIFSDEAYVKRLIEVEAALARAQSSIDVVPHAAATAISDALSQANIE